ncbi:calcitonin protein-related peptide-receptor component protein [Niveomyces insectorum RCEF 264]|uniref:DNA-directed RNA polymerase III subunit RPC9 n=1 Tax=Niveomyces insectorum RCEF 264 TaxID=1081102 RepID=A0A167Z8Q8_9HYPO|nr:calcitonin protein-related peptide-receptor component protein [Niveomyces insectorum RCEF 264]
MKILEAQNALLTNYEVYQFLVERNEQLARQKHARRRGPGNLETLARELLQYFRSPPAPLSQEPLTYSTEAVAQLVERLRGYDLAKGEMLMLLNMRPQTPAQLHACIEEVEGRLSEEQQSAILDIVAEVLGQFPVQQEAEAMEEEEDPDATSLVEGA